MATVTYSIEGTDGPGEDAKVLVLVDGLASEEIAERLFLGVMQLHPAVKFWAICDDAESPENEPESTETDPKTYTVAGQPLTELLGNEVP